MENDYLPLPPHVSRYMVSLESRASYLARGRPPRNDRLLPWPFQGITLFRTFSFFTRLQSSSHLLLLESKKTTESIPTTETTTDSCRGHDIPWNKYQTRQRMENFNQFLEKSPPPSTNLIYFYIKFVLYREGTCSSNSHLHTVFHTASIGIANAKRHANGNHRRIYDPCPVLTRYTVGQKFARPKE